LRLLSPEQRIALRGTGLRQFGFEPADFLAGFLHLLDRRCARVNLVTRFDCSRKVAARSLTPVCDLCFGPLALFGVAFFLVCLFFLILIKLFDCSDIFLGAILSRLLIGHTDLRRRIDLTHRPRTGWAFPVRISDGAVFPLAALDLHLLGGSAIANGDRRQTWHQAKEKEFWAQRHS
jgi:hypothetical protein